MSGRALFYLKNKDLSKFDHVCGSEPWHEQRRSLRTSEKRAHQARKGYNTISKEFGRPTPQSDREALCLEKTTHCIPA